MIIKWFLLKEGVLQEQTSMDGWQQIINGDGNESWFDIQQSDQVELRSFLEKLKLHPVQIDRCVDSVEDPGVVSFGDTSLMEYPTAFDADSEEPGYLTIIINKSLLATVRHGPIPALDDLIKELLINKTLPLRHLPQIVYLILDQFSDLNVDAQIAIREQITRLSKTLAGNPGSVSANELSRLRWKVDKLVSLIEN